MPKRWNPGHYVRADSNLGNVSQLLQTIDLIQNYDNIKGILIQCPWGVLEPTTIGSYVWTALDQCVARAVQYNKKFMIDIKAADYGTSTIPTTVPQVGFHELPDFVIQNGWTQNLPTNNMYFADFSNDQCVTALINLIKAIATRYGSNPAFEMFVSTETSLVSSTIQNSTILKNKFHQNWLRITATMDEFFPNNFCSIESNFYVDETTLFAELVTDCVNRGIALGGPDVAPGYTRLSNGLIPESDKSVGQKLLGGFYTGTTDRRLKIPVKVEAQVIRRTDDTPTLYNRLSNQMYFNTHMVWTVYNPDGYQYNSTTKIPAFNWTSARDFINNPVNAVTRTAFPDLVSGGGGVVVPPAPPIVKNNGKLQPSNGTYAPYKNFNSGVVELDGVEDYITTSKQYLGSELQSFTIAAWVRTDDNRGRKIIGFEKGLEFTSNYDRHLYVGTDGKLHFGVYNVTEGGKIISSQERIDDNYWHYVVGSLENGVTKLYVDGTKVAEGTALGAEVFDGYWIIGGYRLSYWPNASAEGTFESLGFLRGSIAAVQVYNRAILDSEVLTNYNNRKIRFRTISGPTLTLSSTSGTQVGVLVNDTEVASAAISSYIIQRSANLIGPWSSLPNPTKTYVDTNSVVPNTRYYYRAKFIQTDGKTSEFGAVADILSSGTVANPDAPTLRLAAVSSTTIQVFINAISTDNAAPTNYVIERSSDGTTGWTQIYSSSAAAYTDNNLTLSTRYYYRAKFTQQNAQTSPYSLVQNESTFALSQELSDIALMNLGYAVVTQDYPMPGSYTVSGTSVSASGLVNHNKLDAWNIKAGLTRIKIDNEIRTVQSVSTDSLTVSSAFTVSGSSKTMYLVGADKLGVQDSTAVIQAWIKQSTIGEFTNPELSALTRRAPIWFPSGTYSVSDTLRIFAFDRPYILPQGNTGGYAGTLGGDFAQIFGSYSGTRPKIKLTANNPGFQNTSSPKPVVVFMHFSPNEGVKDSTSFNLVYPRRNWHDFELGTKQLPGGTYVKEGVDYQNVYFEGMGSLFSSIWCNIDIDTSQNPGAFGLCHNGCQFSALVDCKVTSTNSYCGFWGLPAAGAPTVNIEVDGGQYGLILDNYKQWAFGSGRMICNLKMSNITVQGIVMGDYVGLSLAGFEVTMSSGKFVATTDDDGKSVSNNGSFIDGYITQPSNIIFDMTLFGKSFYIRNVYTKGTTQLIKYENNPTITGPSSTNWNYIAEYASSSDFTGTTGVTYKKPREAPDYTYERNPRHWNIINGVMSIGAITKEPIKLTVTSTATPPTNLRSKYAVSIPAVDNGEVVYVTDYMPALSGTVSIQSNRTTVVGVNTSFLAELKLGDIIVINRCSRRIRSISSNQNLEVYPAFNEVISGVSAKVGTHILSWSDAVSLSGTFSYTSGSDVVTCSTGHNAVVGMVISLSDKMITSIISATQFRVDSNFTSSGSSSSVRWYLAGPVGTDSAKSRGTNESNIGIGGNISDYKNRIDNGKDSLPAIKAAIDAAEAAGHGRVMLPCGGLKVSNTLVLKSKTKLFGLGNYHTGIGALKSWLPTSPAVILSTVDDINATSTICNFQIAIPRQRGTYVQKTATGNRLIGLGTASRNFFQYSHDRFSCVDWKAGKGLAIMYTYNSAYAAGLVERQPNNVRVELVPSTETEFPGAHFKISGSGGGRFFGLTGPGNSPANPNYFDVLIDGTTQPIHIFAVNPEHKQDYGLTPIENFEHLAGVVVRNASNVRLYNSKREGDTSTFLFLNSNNIAFYDAVGALTTYNGTVRGSCDNILVTNMIPQDHSYLGTEAAGAAYNPRGYVFLDETLPAISGTVSVSGSTITGTGLLAKFPASTPLAGYATLVGPPINGTRNTKYFGSMLIKIGNETREVRSASDTQIIVWGTFSATGTVTAYPVLGVKGTEILSLYKKGSINDDVMW